MNGSWGRGHGISGLRYSEAGSEITTRMTAALNASEARKLRQVKLMRRSLKVRWSAQACTSSKIGGAALMRNQTRLQWPLVLPESMVRFP